MPAHVVLTLIEQGVLFADGMSRNAKFGHCRQCRTVIARGLDHDRVAMGVVVDPYPLSPLGEVAALFSSRRTYELSPHGAYDYRIDYRGPEEILAHPAGTARGDVVVEHACDGPVLAGLSSHIRAIPKPSKREDSSCPF